MTTSSDLKEDQQSLVGDYDAISNVVQLCLDGEAKGDVTKYVIRKAPVRVILTAPPADWRPQRDGAAPTGKS